MKFNGNKITIKRQNKTTCITILSRYNNEVPNWALASKQGKRKLANFIRTKKSGTTFGSSTNYKEINIYSIREDELEEYLNK